jgi:hypothetical protein
MATKRTGKPRTGRPRKPLSPRRGRGRPKVALRNHPERLLRALQVVLIGRGIRPRKAAQLIALFSEFPEVDAEADFKARHPATDGYVVGFDLSKKARGDTGKRALERLKSRVDYLQTLRDLTDDDRRWLLHASAAILMSSHPTLDARQKRAAVAFLLERMGGDPKLAEILATFHPQVAKCAPLQPLVCPDFSGI